MRRRLKHDAAAGDLGRMSGEYWRDADCAEQLVGIFCGDAGLLKPAKCSAQAAALDIFLEGRQCLIERGGKAAALAVVRLGEIDELEVEAEGARQAVGSCEIKGGDALGGLCKMRPG